MVTGATGPHGQTVTSRVIKELELGSDYVTSLNQLMVGKTARVQQLRAIPVTLTPVQVSVFLIVFDKWRQILVRLGLL